MKLSIINGVESYDINLMPVTQLCGKDILKKRFIINSLSKHFSSSRYKDYEADMEDNILIDGNVAGREYFDVETVRGREDIEDEFRISRTSLVKQRLDNMINSLDCQREIENIRECLVRIYDELEKDFFDSESNMEFVFNDSDITEIMYESKVQMSDERAIENASDFELIKNYILLLEKIQSEEGEKKLIILDNLDHLVSVKEYNHIMKMISEVCEKSDIRFIVSTSIDGYVFLEKEYFEGINCINDIVYSMPEYEEIKNYIEFNYPVNYEFSDEEFKNMLMTFLHNVGRESYVFDVRGYIAEKLINQSECLKVNEPVGLKIPEMKFL